MIDEFRQGVMDPEAAFPTISHKVDVQPYHMVYRDNGSVNARCAFYCYNPPIAGKRITVQAWIADKYARRGKNYIVTEAVSVDEDGRLLDRVITHELKQTVRGGQEMAMTRIYNVGDQVTPLSKTMTQEAINLFEKSGGKTGPSQFTDETDGARDAGHERHSRVGTHVADVRDRDAAALLRDRGL